MNQISAKLADLLLGSGDHTGNLGPLVGERRHNVTFRHIHPRSQNDRGDYLLQADMMSAMRLVFMRHDTALFALEKNRQMPIMFLTRIICASIVMVTLFAFS
jgi:hypothetical protein